MQAGFTDIDGARAFLGNCSVTSIYRRIYAGDLKKYKLGGKTLFKLSELETLPILQDATVPDNNPGQPEAA